MIKTILEILAFALVTMLLYSWGYVKQQRQPSDLLKILNSKAEKKIIKLLKKNESVTKKDIEKELKGLKAWVFGSRNRVEIKEPEKLTKIILDNLIKRDIIEVKIIKGRKSYVLKG